MFIPGSVVTRGWGEPVASGGAVDLGGAVDEAADVDLLAGPAAGELLHAVLEAEGVRLTAWSVHQVHHRPGVGVTVGWRVDWESGAARGSEYLLGTTAPVPTVATSTTVLHEGRTLHVWRHPADPALPGLVAASDVTHVAALLGTDPATTTLDLVTYRPLRRAVLRATSPGRAAYLKVVRPHVAADLHARHRLLAAAGLPVAPATVHADGLIRLDVLEGRPLIVSLAADGASQVSPHLVLDLLDRLPRELVGLPRRPSWSDRVESYAHAAAVAVPGRREEILGLGREVAGMVAGADPGPVVATHGDLHGANLLLTGAEVTGLLDVDSAGPGHRVDDLACLLGHLSVLPALAPGAYRHVPRILPRWVAVMERGVDPVALRARAAAVALSLVAGARTHAGEEGPGWTDDAGRRLDVVRGWLEDARRLRDLSSARPAALIRPHQADQHAAGQLVRTDEGERP
ncbi:aminoglycoside phosphotransferase family protein [Actinotalea sp. K2]|uniref:phosphotransferase n=1 Tax=Actinotalea sp. K2 TaxID=2939438 RepID=UPI0020174EEE|nr:aminoglycoside phosphotransferase family protein [Actinotalea sp. K2]MCL3860057.1 aminoglycoside phosphotransferase family protein [Actinotalea sp. K2]